MSVRELKNSELQNIIEKYGESHFGIEEKQGLIKLASQAPI